MILHSFLLYDLFSRKKVFLGFQLQMKASDKSLELLCNSYSVL